MKLPPDIDRLAWSVAESGDPKLRAEFAHRYPEFAPELDRRVTLVQDRGETPAHAASGIALPVRKAAVPTWAYVLAGLAIGGVIFAVMTPTRAAEPYRAPASSVGAVATTIPTRDPASVPTSSSTVQDIPPVSTADPEPAASNSGSKPTSMRLEGTALHDALALIAAAGQLTIRVDPDIPDTQVREELTDLTPRQMISRLGEEYGFRIVEESATSLVLVPLGEPQDGTESNPRPEPQVPSTPPSDTDFPVFANGNP